MAPRRPDPPAYQTGILGAITAALIAATAWLVVRRVMLAPFTYSLWSDRDLVRSAVGLWNVPTAGAELSYGTGARVPGGAQYILFALVQAVNDHPVTVQRAIYVLDAAGLVVLGLTALRLGGGLAAALTMAAALATAVTHEGLAQLWNPALLPLFIAVALLLGTRMAEERSAHLLGLWTASVGIAMQFHLSAGLWASTMLVGLVAVGVRGWRAALPKALGALLLVYAPYLLSELLNGAPNTLAMWWQPHARALDEGAEVRWRFSEAVSALGWLLGGRTELGIDAIWNPVRWLWALGLAATAGAAVIDLRAGRPEGRALAVVVISTVLTVGWLIADPFISTAPRYLFVAVPGVGLAVGLGLARLVAQTGGFAPNLAILFALGVALPSRGWWERLDDVVGGPYERQLERLRAVRALHGWSWAEVAGRTVVITERTEEGGLGWKAYGGIDDLLRREGEAFPGSLAPPCAAVIQVPLGPDEDAGEAVRAALGLPKERFWVDEEYRQDGIHFLTYFPGEERCPTSLINRYLDTPMEAELREAYLQVPDGGVLSLPSDNPATRRTLVHLRVPRAGEVGPLVLGLELEQHATSLWVDVLLHSNQLRGEALNEGWFGTALVRGLRVNFAPVDELGAVEHLETFASFGADLVGYRGAAAPLQTVVRLHPGTWRVVITLDVLDPTAQPWPPTDVEGWPVELHLMDDFVVHGFQ